MPDVDLATPGSLDELYLARGEDVVAARPVLTGDVFTGVEVDLDDHDGTVMVVAHPCSMRGAGGRLLPRIAVAPVRPYQHVAFERWPAGHYKVLPLPALYGDDDGPRAVHLLELSAVRSEKLDRGRRILSLTDCGIYVLQQRLIHSLTRVVVGLDRLQEQAAHVLLAAELQQDWVDELAEDEDAGAVATAAEEFNAFMDTGHRAALLEVIRRTDTVRAVCAEIRHRRDEAA